MSAISAMAAGLVVSAPWFFFHDAKGRSGKGNKIYSMDRGRYVKAEGVIWYLYISLTTWRTCRGRVFSAFKIFKNPHDLALAILPSNASASARQCCPRAVTQRVERLRWMPRCEMLGAYSLTVPSWVKDSNDKHGMTWRDLFRGKMQIFVLRPWCIKRWGEKRQQRSWSQRFGFFRFLPHVFSSLYIPSRLYTSTLPLPLNTRLFECVSRLLTPVLLHFKCFHQELRNVYIERSDIWVKKMARKALHFVLWLMSNSVLRCKMP